MNIMKKFLFALSAVLLLSPALSYGALSDTGAEITAFDVAPGVQPKNLTVGQLVPITLVYKLDIGKFGQFCGDSSLTSFNWEVYEKNIAVDSDFYRTPQVAVQYNRTQTIISGTINASIEVKLINKGDSSVRAEFSGKIFCPNNNTKKAVESAPVEIKLVSGLKPSYACIAPNGNYACSPSNLSNCSDVVGGGSGCSANCKQVPLSLCGTKAPSDGSFPSPAVTPKPVGSTPDKTYSFEITNPLKGGPNDLFEIINIATRLLLQISIPLAVLWILYAGYLMLTAGPTPAKFEKGKGILKNVVIGLAVIFIGRGFITLIYSILELGGNTTPTTQTGTAPNNGSCSGNVYLVNGQQAGTCRNGLVTDEQVCVNESWWQAGKDLKQKCSTKCLSGVCQNGFPGTCTRDSDCLAHKPIGGVCNKTGDCNSGLVCQNNMCQRQDGNNIGEPCLNGSSCNPVGYKVTADNVHYACDNSVVSTIDGREVGVCYEVNK